MQMVNLLLHPKSAIGTNRLRSCARLCILLESRRSACLQIRVRKAMFVVPRFVFPRSLELLGCIMSHGHFNWGICIGAREFSSRLWIRSRA